MKPPNCSTCFFFAASLYGNVLCGLKPSIKCIYELSKTLFIWEEEPKRSVVVEEIINGKNYTFDNTACMLILKRLMNVMGEETTVLMI